MRPSLLIDRLLTDKEHMQTRMDDERVELTY